MIALVHGARAFGAVERYAAALLRGLGERDAPAVLVAPDHPSVASFAEAAGGSVALDRYDAALLDGPAHRLVADLVRRLWRRRARVVHVIDVFPQALVAARVAGVRRLLITHHTPELPRADSLAGRALLALGWLMRPTLIYTSEADRSGDRRRLPSVVVPLGIDLDRFRHAEPALAHDGPVVGNVGRVVAQKGQLDLVEALPRVLEHHPRTRLVIVGDGDLRPALEARARELGVADAVELTGERDDVPALLASFDVFAYPSRFEGLCLAVIEAQAAGVPVVATPVGGIVETVIDGVTGLTVRAGDVRGLADVVVRLLNDGALAERLAAEAAARVGRFSESAMVEATLALYGTLSP